MGNSEECGSRSNRVPKTSDREMVRTDRHGLAGGDVVALIDSRPLLRASVELLLESWSAEFCVIPFTSADEYLAGIGQDQALVAVVLYSVAHGDLTSPALQQTVLRLTAHDARTAVVILSDREDTPQIKEAFRLGARGYLSTSAEPSLTVGVVRLVQAGGTFIPPQLLNEGLNLGGMSVPAATEPEGAMQATRPSAAAGQPVAPVAVTEATAMAERARLNGLTPRQCAVLDLLRQGKQNKMIAYQLDMRESTVKVHVRQIMKKLHACNRTEAAILAQEFSLC